MAADDIISKLKRDNVLAQRIQCGRCGMPMAQSPGGLSEANLVTIKGRRLGIDSEEDAKGLMCGNCLEHPRFSKQGPRNAITMDEETGDIRPVYFDNLLNSNQLKAIAQTRKEEEERKEEEAAARQEAYESAGLEVPEDEEEEEEEDETGRKTRRRKSTRK